MLIMAFFAILGRIEVLRICSLLLQTE